MDGWKIQELRAAVLSDLREFIPKDYYKSVHTDEDVAYGDITLSKRLQEKQYKTPQLTPRQLAAVWLLERIGLYCHKYESADPAADAAEGITPESIKEMSLEHLHDALRRYTAYNGADEARAHLMPADVPAAVKQAAHAKVKTRGGRPKTIDKKVFAVREMLERFECAASIKFTPKALCGSAADLLDACQRFEKSNKIKPLIFRTSQDTFNGWLKRAGYSFPTGRTPDIEKNYWTRLVVKVSV